MAAQITVDLVWERFSARLRAFIRSRVEDDDSAEDILQEVFLRIHTHLVAVQDVNRLESWLYQVCRNAIIDHYRRRRAHVELAETLPDDFDLPEGPDAAEEIAASLGEVLAALPEPYRQALTLTDLEGLSQQELAVRLGISLSGAKSRVQRGRQKIRDALLTCCHFEFDRYGRVIDYWAHCCCCAEQQPNA